MTNILTDGFCGKYSQARMIAVDKSSIHQSNATQNY